MLGSRVNQYNPSRLNKINSARSTFDRSHQLKDTHNVDYLYPVLVDELLPGDTIDLTVNNFSRLASASKVPLMDNLYTKIFAFVTPYRILWDNWTKMLGVKQNPGDSTDFTTPQVPLTAADATVNSLWDKFGVTGAMLGGNTKNISALFSRNYNMIYREWFRHTLLQDSPVVDTGDGPDDPDDYVLRKVTKAFNYFTAALPEPQAGNAVDLPLGTSAPIIVNPSDANAAKLRTDSTHAYWTTTGNLTNNGSAQLAGAGGQTLILDPNGSLIADLTNATAASVNAWREAVKMQEIFELDNRGGNRWVEILSNRFNTNLPDYTAQRPEYIGGAKFTLNSHVVPQTSPTSGSNAQGQLAAFGTIAGQARMIKTVQEHSVLMVLAVHTGEISYQQGLPKMLTRRTRFDYAEFKLQELGDQAILTEEIYCDGSATDDDVFGYIPRYDDYRYAPSRIRGEFNSSYSAPLDQWHLAEEFASAPELNEAFILANTPIERNQAVTSGPDILADFWFSYAHTRQLVTYGVPLVLGRF